MDWQKVEKTKLFLGKAWKKFAFLKSNEFCVNDLKRYKHRLSELSFLDRFSHLESVNFVSCKIFLYKIESLCAFKCILGIIYLI